MRKIGGEGEERAARFLKRLGYQILHRNWRCRRGEIDIIARDGKTLVFTEVKTRRSTSRGTPEEAVDRKKQEKLRLLARYYIHETGMTAPVYRFDVLTVDAKSGEIKLLKSAFS